MAEHFLDTETRPEIPGTAALCVEAGLGIGEACDIWCHEVHRAVGFNMRDPAGVWAGWDEDWLVARIRSLPRPLPFQRWFSLASRNPFWRSIERGMEIFLRHPPEDRLELERDLTALARHYFDFCPQPLDPHGRWQADLPNALFYVLEPASLKGEARAGRVRVEQALAAVRGSQGSTPA